MDRIAQIQQLMQAGMSYHEAFDRVANAACAAKAAGDKAPLPTADELAKNSERLRLSCDRTRGLARILSRLGVGLGDATVYAPLLRDDVEATEFALSVRAGEPFALALKHATRNRKPEAA